MRAHHLACAAVVLAACAGAGTSETTNPGPTTASPSTTLVAAIPICSELEWIAGPEELYGDTPVYVSNEMPIEAVIQHASTMDGFIEAWIDREHNGWVNVGFKGVDLSRAQDELSTIFPDDGVVAVDLPYTHEELEEIRQRVAAVLPDGFDASNTHVLHGRVEIWVRILTEEAIETVRAAVGHEPVCVGGGDPASTPEPGPQPEGGDGWRFLGVFDTSVAPQPVVIGDDATFAVLWSGVGGGEPPEIDFESSIVVAYEIGYSGSCPETRLDEVTVDDTGIQPKVVTISEEMMCTADYNPRTYVFAVDRAALPAPPFTVGDAIEVGDDLREPGSVPTRVGPAPVVPGPDLPDLIEVGFPWPATIDLECGVEALGPINGVVWVSDLEATPPEWTDAAQGALLEVSLLMREGPDPTLTVTAAGFGVAYVPDPGASPPGC